VRDADEIERGLAAFAHGSIRALLPQLCADRKSTTRRGIMAAICHPKRLVRERSAFPRSPMRPSKAARGASVGG